MALLVLSLAPVFIILIYIYFRDKYEKEPLGLLFKSLFMGGIIVLPVGPVESFFVSVSPGYGTLFSSGYEAFVVAGFTEELFKFAALYFLIWKNSNFNEKFDGIIYAVFVSLGFAAVENIMYVMQGGIEVAMVRSITAVPAHALFGITMGYFFGIAHMEPQLRKAYLAKAFFIPFILHGIYDFILISQKPFLLLFFVPYLAGLYISGFRKMKVISDASVFRKRPPFKNA